MSNPTTLRLLVQQAMEGILFDHHREGVRVDFHPDFIQHNPWAADGGVLPNAG